MAVAAPKGEVDFENGVVDDVTWGASFSEIGQSADITKWMEWVLEIGSDAPNPELSLKLKALLTDMCALMGQTNLTCGAFLGSIATDSIGKAHALAKEIIDAEAPLSTQAPCIHKQSVSYFQLIYLLEQVCLQLEFTLFERSIKKINHSKKELLLVHSTALPALFFEPFTKKIAKSKEDHSAAVTAFNALKKALSDLSAQYSPKSVETLHPIDQRGNHHFQNAILDDIRRWHIGSAILYYRKAPDAAEEALIIERIYTWPAGYYTVVDMKQTREAKKKINTPEEVMHYLKGSIGSDFSATAFKKILQQEKGISDSLYAFFASMKSLTTSASSELTSLSLYAASLKKEAKGRLKHPDFDHLIEAIHRLTKPTTPTKTDSFLETFFLKHAEKCHGKPLTIMPILEEDEAILGGEEITCVLTLVAPILGFKGAKELYNFLLNEGRSSPAGTIYTLAKNSAKADGATLLTLFKGYSPDKSKLFWNSNQLLEVSEFEMLTRATSLLKVTKAFYSDKAVMDGLIATGDSRLLLWKETPLAQKILDGVIKNQPVVPTASERIALGNLDPLMEQMRQRFFSLLENQPLELSPMNWENLEDLVSAQEKTHGGCWILKIKELIVAEKSSGHHYLLLRTSRRIPAGSSEFLYRRDLYSNIWGLLSSQNEEDPVSIKEFFDLIKNTHRNASLLECHFLPNEPINE